jgi:putative ABC transport system permease protein
MMVMIALRRARRDAGVLLVWIALVAFAVLLAIAGPRLQKDTVDSSARQAVATAGSATDVLVGAHVGDARDSFLTPVKASDILALAQAIPGRLPAALRTVYAGSALAVVSPSTRMTSLDGVATSSRPVDVQLDLLTPQNEKTLAYAAGVAPASSGPSSDVDVVVSATAAEAAGLTVGSVAQVSTIPVASADSGSHQLNLRVVGIVNDTSGASGDASPWRDMSTVWKPVVPDDRDATAPIQIAVLASAAGVESASARYSDSFSATLRIRLRPAAFTDALERQVGASIVALAAHSHGLNGDVHGQLSVSSEYGPALADYPATAGAATAQISIVAAGVLGAAAALILLVSNLLVARRAADTALERARGASLGSIGGRALAESAVFGVIGAAMGALVALGLRALPIVQPWLVLAVGVVALLAVPMQTVVAARSTWAGRRVPANRADRVEAQRRVRARRIAVELTLIALAVAAFTALLRRGLLETGSNGVDPLLASAPLFIAVVVTIVVLRIYRWPLLLAAAAGRRSMGALGLLAAVRAQRSIAVLPLLALTISVALAVGAGLLGSTVTTGQEAASWQRVGADVRVDAPVSTAQAARVAKAPGVTGESTYFDRDGIQLRLGTGTGFATLVAVEPGFGPFIERAPGSGVDLADVGSLDRLSKATPASSPLPIVLDAGLASEVSGSDIGMYYGHTFVPVRVVGTISDAQAGYLAAPFLYVDRDALAQRLGHPVAAGAILIDGPGALAAARALAAPTSAVHTRAAWLTTRQARAEVGGVAGAISLAMISAAILAALALIVTVLGGARERGRSLSLVRTLGLRASAGTWLALAELAPVVLAALVGGVVAGIGMVLLLEPAMGLRALTGGLGNPPPTVSAPILVALVSGAILLLLGAVVIEFAIRRRDRLSEVLRVGETA